MIQPRLFLRLLVLPLLLCTFLRAAQQTASSPVYRITGIVVSSTDGTPVRHAHLNANPSGARTGGLPRNRFSPLAPSAGASADADEYGHFTLTLPSAGAWNLTASGSGYITQSFEAHGMFSSAVVVTPSSPTYDLRFRLPPEAIITGTVIDEAGEPVRDARVILQQRALPSPDRELAPFQTRMNAQTDDRGIYEFPNLGPADYRLMVEARPWYAQSNRPQLSLNGTTPPSDPALDVTYQMTWYPGVDLPEQAEIITLHAADTRTADFHLAPIPALHLQVILPTSATPVSNGPISGRTFPIYPVLERIDTGGAGPGVVQSIGSSTGPAGRAEIDGLAPGLYRLRLQGQNRNAQSSIVEIAPGSSSQVVDASSSSVQTANIAIDLDLSDEDRAVGVELRSPETGRRFTSFDTNMFLASDRRGPQTQEPRQITMQVPPGRYEIALTGRGNTYLTEVTGKGAQITGRFLTVPAGDVSLTLHTASGHATVTGIATMNGKPIVGAMLLLVPAGLGDPKSFTSLVRDQTNTDGSFDLNNVVPGPYILIAIDRGWELRWSDPATLEHYLTQGVPLALKAGDNIWQEITAQTP